MEDFGKHFLKLCKANFPNLTHVKKKFPDSKQRNCPLYYLQTIQALSLTEPYLEKQLMVTFLLTLNFSGNKEIYEELKEQLPPGFSSF